MMCYNEVCEKLIEIQLAEKFSNIFSRCLIKFSLNYLQETATAINQSTFSHFIYFQFIL
jgi:hypothetical protein